MDKKRQELKILINGTPDLKQMPKEVADSFLAALELDICAWVDSKKSEENKKGG